MHASMCHCMADANDKQNQENTSQISKGCLQALYMDNIAHPLWRAAALLSSRFPYAEHERGIVQRAIKNPGLAGFVLASPNQMDEAQETISSLLHSVPHCYVHMYMHGRQM